MYSQSIPKTTFFLGKAPQNPPAGGDTPPTLTPAPLALDFAPSLHSGAAHPLVFFLDLPLIRILLHVGYCLLKEL